MSEKESVLSLNNGELSINNLTTMEALKYAHLLIGLCPFHS